MKPKVAIIHDYLISYGGAEKTLEAMLEIFPEAQVYTGIYSPKNLPETITKRKIIATKSRLIEKFPKHLIFLMPLVFENFDLSEYDLIISEGTAWPKGVITKPEQLHIGYIHTPPRFLYKYSGESQNQKKWYLKPAIIVINFFLRIWDYYSAQRPKYLLSNSEEIRKRVQKFYKRDSLVIYPPVDTEYKLEKAKPKGLQKPYYLLLGRLVAYKNIDLVINAFNLIGLNLKIVGTGPEESKLKKLAGENDKIEFLGHVSEKEKHEMLENCLGVIFPVKDEDFGIVPIEAMAHGKPVLAHKSGGPLETVKEGVSGMFFDEIELENFINKMKDFDEKITNKVFDPEMIKKTTQKYSKDRFKEELSNFIKEKWEEHARTTRSTDNNNRPK